MLWQYCDGLHGRRISTPTLYESKAGADLCKAGAQWPALTLAPLIMGGSLYTLTLEQGSKPVTHAFLHLHTNGSPGRLAATAQDRRALHHVRHPRCELPAQKAILSRGTRTLHVMRGDECVITKSQREPTCMLSSPSKEHLC